MAKLTDTICAGCFPGAESKVAKDVEGLMEGILVPYRNIITAVVDVVRECSRQTCIR